MRPIPAANAVQRRAVHLPLKPGDYRRLGMSFVHQNLGLVPSLTVLENLRLVQLTSGKTVLSTGAPRAAARDGAVALRPRSRSRMSGSTGLRRSSGRCSPSFAPSRRSSWRAPSPASRASCCSTSRRRSFREPASSSCSRSSVRSPRSGSSVIFISHDIDEVMEITDRISVLRDGARAGELDRAGHARQDRRVDRRPQPRSGPAAHVAVIDRPVSRAPAISRRRCSSRRILIGRGRNPRADRADRLRLRRGSLSAVRRPARPVRRDHHRRATR